MRINLIFARARNGVIGAGNTLPWHLPQDLAHFKRLTAGYPVIMGRRTWDSLPERFRPLPARTNFVVTRQAQWQAPGARPVGSLEQALGACADAEPTPAEVWVIGGAQLYALALPLAHRAIVTELARDFEGDAFAPGLGPQWVEVARASHATGDGMRFDFVTYLNQNHNQKPTPGPTHV